MKHLNSTEDLDFKRRFESCEIPASDFDHRAHLRLAYVYLAENDTESSVQLMKNSLKRFLEHNGVEPTKYHETLTKAWILALRHFMSTSKDSNSAEELISQNSEILDTEIMMSHYSAEVLFSNEARNAFVPPNLDPIPRQKESTVGYEDVLSFWFDEIEHAKWWSKDLGFDRLIENKFLALHQQAKQCELFEWRNSARGRLAEIIVLDQFSRNIFRDKAQAFSSDQLALALAQEAISLGKHHELNAVERSFMYMPYMHSESLNIHDIAVELYKNNAIQSNVDFEIKHRDIIAKYGRYPHRNAILNRVSTAEEIAFLQQPGSAF